MDRELIRRIGIAALVLLVLVISTIWMASWRNGQRLDVLKDEFCSMELPPDSQRRQCHGIRGTIALTAGPGSHCDYLVWMKLGSNTEPPEVVEWFEQRPLTGTDGDAQFVPEVFQSKADIAADGFRFRYHVQVIDAGHRPGIDLQCYLDF